MLALVFALREAKPLLAPVLIAVVLTFVLAPAVRGLCRRGLPPFAAALLVVGALLGTTVPVVAAVARPAVLWWEAAPATVAQLLARLDAWRARIPGLGPPPPARPVLRPAGQPPAAAEPAPDPLKTQLANEGIALTRTVLAQGTAFAVATAATLILLVFLLASEHWMLRRVVEAVPRRRARALLLAGVRAAQRDVGQYLVAVALINAAAGAVTALGLWLVGLPNPTLWGAMVAVLCFVPYLGPLALMGLLLLAGVTGFEGGPRMLAPLAVFVVVHAIESNFISPWFVGRRLALSPVSVFLAVLFWGWLWGIAGALIAVPLLIALRAASLRVRRLSLLRRLLEGDRVQPPSLRSLLGRPGRTPRPAEAAGRAPHQKR